MIPIDYLSRHEAASIIAAAKFAGTPDRAAVLQARLTEQNYNRASSLSAAKTFREIIVGYVRS